MAGGGTVRFRAPFVSWLRSPCSLYLRFLSFLRVGQGNAGGEDEA